MKLEKILKGDFFTKKITKALVAILLIAVMSTSSVVAFAADAGIDPRLSHTDSGGFTFAAENNVGYIGVTYYGYDSFVRADLNVKVQKRFLLVMQVQPEHLLNVLDKLRIKMLLRMILCEIKYMTC